MPELMSEAEFADLAKTAFRRVEDAFADVDPDLVDFDRAGDVLSLVFRGARKCVLNTQRPTRQLWLAFAAQAWHFRYDSGSKSWVDEKNPKTELFDMLATLAKGATGQIIPV
jgi:CyaY protein